MLSLTEESDGCFTAETVLYHLNAISISSPSVLFVVAPIHKVSLNTNLWMTNNDVMDLIVFVFNVINPEALVTSLYNRWYISLPAYASQHVNS